ncbi:MAG: hypothetical protein HC805_05605 [Alkalinema sp. RL_2_19]|nr:hypothetical protein [Alkalinema sp. RL_2_19]
MLGRLGVEERDGDVDRGGELLNDPPRLRPPLLLALAIDDEEEDGSRLVSSPVTSPKVSIPSNK